jgi:hypothetical protein
MPALQMNYAMDELRDRGPDARTTDQLLRDRGPDARTTDACN